MCADKLPWLATHSVVQLGDKLKTREELRADWEAFQQKQKKASRGWGEQEAAQCRGTVARHGMARGLHGAAAGVQRLP